MAIVLEGSQREANSCMQDRFSSSTTNLNKMWRAEDITQDSKQDRGFGDRFYNVVLL
jgi:hypothetical protein